MTNTGGQMVFRAPSRPVIYGGAAAGLTSEDEVYARLGVAPGLVGKGAAVGLSDVALAKTVNAAQRGDAQAKRVALQAGVDNEHFFVAKKSWLDKVSKGVDFAIQGVVLGGLAVGAAGVAGFGPAASGAAPAAGGTGTYGGMALAGGSGPVGATVVPAGTGLAGGAGGAVAGAGGGWTAGGVVAGGKAVASLAGSVAGLAGTLKAAKAAGSKPAASSAPFMPLTPGAAAAPGAGKNILWLVLAALAVAAFSK